MDQLKLQDFITSRTIKHRLLQNFALHERLGNQSYGTLVSSLAVLILLTLLLTALYRLTLHPLAGIPGPFIAKITGHWRNYRYYKGTWHNDVLNLHSRYGRVVRLAPNEVSIVDEQAMKVLYGHGTIAPKTKWYSVWEVPNTGPQLFAEQDRKVHGFLRKRVAGAYSMSSILKYEVYIQGCLDLMMSKLANHAKQGHVVNMSDWTNAFAFDVVGELAYGSQLGHLQTESDVNDLRKTIYKGFFIMANLGYVPGQSSWVNSPIMTKLIELLGLPPPMGSFQEWTGKQVKERMENKEKYDREDLLAHFCRMKGPQGDEATFPEVMIEALNIIGAGADTTSIGMRAILYYLCFDAKAYDTVQSEVDQFYRDNNLEQPITYNQIQQLPYLQAVVKEATRLLPSIVFQLPRYAPPNFSVRGYNIPAGTQVGISPLAQNRDQDIWGQDADVFRPERWLEDVTRSKYLDTNNMTFGGNGPRMCVGRNIALVELHKFIAQFIHHFDFEFLDKNNPWKISSYWFAYQHDLNMRIKLRPQYPVRQVEI